MTMIVVTHEMQFAEDVSDRVIFMDHGPIVEQGRRASCSTRPSHARTQAFLRAVLDASQGERRGDHGRWARAYHLISARWSCCSPARS